MRFIKYLTGAWAGLLAACGSPPPASAPGAGPQPASVAGTAPRAPAPPVQGWDDYKLRAAQRIMASNADATFSGPLPDPLQSIPVVQVQLNADGSVRNIVVLRVPKFMPQTVEMAIGSIRRAAPFGPVGHLPRPWQFNETFLYNDELKFQLRTLVEAD